MLANETHRFTASLGYGPDLDLVTKGLDGMRGLKCNLKAASLTPETTTNRQGRVA